MAGGGVHRGESAVSWAENYLRQELGDDYVAALFRVWDRRVAEEADLCCYWFEKAREVKHANDKRAGLLWQRKAFAAALNRQSWNESKNTGDIFFAESDRDWILDGANVHVSMVGFDNGDEANRVSNGNAAGQ